MEGILTSSIFIGLIIGGLIGYSIGNDKAEREKKERNDLFSVLVGPAIHPHPVDAFEEWCEVIRFIERNIDTEYKENEFKRLLKNHPLINHYRNNAEKYINAISCAIHEYEQKHSIKFPRSVKDCDTTKQETGSC